MAMEELGFEALRTVSKRCVFYSKKSMTYDNVNKNFRQRGSRKTKALWPLVSWAHLSGMDGNSPIKLENNLKREIEEKLGGVGLL